MSNSLEFTPHFQSVYITFKKTEIIKDGYCRGFKLNSLHKEGSRYGGAELTKAKTVQKKFSDAEFVVV